jgi:hypothetical protein
VAITRRRAPAELHRKGADTSRRAMDEHGLPRGDVRFVEEGLPAVTATTGTAAAAMSSSPTGFLAIIPDKTIAYSA